MPERSGQPDGTAGDGNRFGRIHAWGFHLCGKPEIAWAGGTIAVWTDSSGGWFHPVSPSADTDGKVPLPFPFMAGFHGTGCRKPDGTEPHISSESIPFFGSEISQRYRFNSGNHSGRPFRYSISFQKFCGPVFHSYMPGRSGPDEKFPHAGKKAPACGLPVLPDILCSPSRFAVMSDRKPCSGW